MNAFSKLLGAEMIRQTRMELIRIVAWARSNGPISREEIDAARDCVSGMSDVQCVALFLEIGELVDRGE